MASPACAGAGCHGNGSLKEVEDAKGNVTQYEYNGFMALKKTTYPHDTYEEPTYDEYRRVIETRGRSGQTISFTYDGLNRVSGKTVENPYGAPINNIVYQYDLLGRVYRVTDNTGTTKNTYDKAGRLIRVQYPGGKTVSYLYDAAGNRTRLTYPDSTYITYDYDELNRLTAVRNSAGTALASYSFDARSRRTGLTYTNGASAAYSYDVASRLLYIDNQTGNGQHIPACAGMTILQLHREQPCHPCEGREWAIGVWSAAFTRVGQVFPA